MTKGTETMNLEEFERQVIAGEINDFNTDFKLYFEQAKDDDIRDKIGRAHV